MKNQHFISRVMCILLLTAAGVFAGSPVITTTALPAANSGCTYNERLTASGGVPPYHNWTVVSGSIGYDLGLDSASGIISGFAAAPQGTYTFAVTVQDSTGATSPAQQLGIVQNHQPPIALTGLTPDSQGFARLSDAYVGVPYSYNMHISGGIPPYKWTIIGNAFWPVPGLNLDTSTGILSGTPTQVGNFEASFLITDQCSGSYSTPNIEVFVFTLPTILNLPPPAGTVGQGYSFQVYVQGGEAPYTWNLAGSLPPGLSGAPAPLLGPNIFLINGTPTTSAGSPYTFTLTATDSYGLVSKPQTFSIPIGDQLTLSSSSLTFTSKGGVAPPTQNLTISESGGGTSYQTKITYNQGSGWLNVTPASGPLSQQTLAVSTNPTALQAGNYSAVLALTTDKGATTSVNVSLAVQENLSVSPASLNFTYRQGDPSPPATTPLFLFSSPEGLQFTSASSTSGGGSWLSAGAGGTLPGSIAVSVNPITLAPGTYSGSIVVTPLFGVAVTVPVALSVLAPIAPRLTVGQRSQNFAMTFGSLPVSGSVSVTNSGGGTLQYTANAASDQNSWLSLSGGASGTATTTAPASIPFSVNPAGLSSGLYNGAITLKDAASGDQTVVGITLVVSQASASMSLSREGIEFFAPAGGAPPPGQSFSIICNGPGSLNWTASLNMLTQPQANWLSLSAASGTARAGSPGLVRLNVSSTGLAQGQYYAAVSISSPDAVNSPQQLTVILSVGSGGVQLSAGGVVLSGASLTRTSAAQSVSLFNASTSPIGYSVSTFTQNRAPWLSVSPASGTLNPGANTLTIQAAFDSLGPGLQAGNVTIELSDGTFIPIQTVANAESGGCTAALAGVFRQPLDQSVAFIAQPQEIQVQIVDRCGNPLAASGGGQVQVTFDNGDPSLNLVDTGSGIWEGTWTPAKAASRVILHLFASESSGGTIVALTSPSSLSTNVQSSPGAPPQPTALVNAAAGAQASPLVVTPGAYIAIYGDNIGGTTPSFANTIPLPTALGGTNVYLGGVALPLLYAGSGQVNAVIPQSLEPNAAYPLIVVRGSEQSMPISVTTAAFQPGIYSVDSSGSGQGVITIANTSLLAAPSSGTARPAVHGVDFITIYCTGLGPVKESSGAPPPADGAAPPLNLLYQTASPVSVSIGGVTATPIFAGLTPTLVALYEVNVQVPEAVTVGDSVPVFLTVTDPQTGLSARSNVVTISVQ